MRYLYIIPARKGSKGVPGKNKRPLRGKPLIQHTIEVAKEVASTPEDICVTTDDLEIIEIAKELAVPPPFIRPEQFAQDRSSSEEVISHALRYYQEQGRKYDALILLQPTSPFRTAKHLREAIALYEEEDTVDMVVSVKETSSNPYYVLFEEDREGFLHKSKEGNFTRRQDCPKVWEYNGAIYIINIRSFQQHGLTRLPSIKKYVMDELSSHDIDSELDWVVAEHLLTTTLNPNS